MDATSRPVNEESNRKTRRGTSLTNVARPGKPRGPCNGARCGVHMTKLQAFLFLVNLIP
jgi:hypothetical protein